MDARIYRAFNRFAGRTAWLHGVAAAYAKYGIALFALLLLAVFLRGRRRGALVMQAGSLWAGGASLAALVLGQVIGHIVRRPRPYATIHSAHVLISRTTDFSFPSDHALAVGAVAAGLLVVDRLLGSVATALAVSMAIARVYVGAHYLSDVAAGLVIGATMARVGATLAVPRIGSVLASATRRPALAAITGTRSDGPNGRPDDDNRQGSPAS